MKNVIGRIRKMLGKIEFFRQVKEINARYAQPRIKMTPMVRYALLLLRIYLIMLVLLVGYKFFIIIKGGII